jgi:hypothetical protein
MTLPGLSDARVCRKHDAAQNRDPAPSLAAAGTRASKSHESRRYGPAAHVTSMYQDALASAPGKPVIYTESGYFTAYDYSSGAGVDYQTQAKNTLNLLADA